MRFYYGKQDFCDLDRAQENGMLLTNGLGGYVSMTSACSVNRCDQGILIAAVKAPNVRISMVHRLQEKMMVDGKEFVFSTQEFADKTEAEEGYRYLDSFSYEDFPQWKYRMEGVLIKRKLSMGWEKNVSAVSYEIENTTDKDCIVEVLPFFKLAPKEDALEEKKEFSYKDGMISGGNYEMYVKSNGELKSVTPQWQSLSYAEDAKDGRPEEGLCGCCCIVEKKVAAGTTEKLEIIFSMKRDNVSVTDMEKQWLDHRREVENCCTLTDPLARRLVLAADDYIVQRESTNGKTILAGYPLFSDWGRDTMIALS